jgi:hypothetical protein
MASSPKLGALEESYSPISISVFVFARLWIQTKMLLQNHSESLLFVLKKDDVFRACSLFMLSKSCNAEHQRSIFPQCKVA